jgi:DNA replication initiation complex subunit (GINS family)
MGEKEINVTFETLFELLRREKSREELQQLDTSFFKDVEDYLREKRNFIQASKEKDPSFDDGKLDKQLENIKRMFTDLMDRRQQKILQMAITKSKTGSELSENLLPEEEELFSSTLARLKCFRSRIDALAKGDAQKIEPCNEEKSSNQPAVNIQSVRFIHPVPKFLGLNREVYGPFEAGDTADLPEAIAGILAAKGRAELTEPNKPKDF